MLRAGRKPSADQRLETDKHLTFRDGAKAVADCGVWHVGDVRECEAVLDEGGHSSQSLGSEPPRASPRKIA